MSLLLDALKRAELAKQRQQASDNDTTLPVTKRPEGSAPDAPADSPQGTPPLDAGSAPGAGAGVNPLETAPPVMTKDRLPVLDQPVEIVAESARRGSSSLELSLEETVPPTPRPAAAGSATASSAASAASASTGGRSGAKPWESSAEDRDTARQLFEVKQMDYNPRRPFYITLAALGLFAVGTAVYFWYEMQPRTNFVVASQVPPPAPAPNRPPAPRPEQLATASPSIPAAPSVTVKPTADSLPDSVPTPGASTTPAMEVSAPAPAAALSIQPSRGVVNPLVPLPGPAADAPARAARVSAQQVPAQQPAAPQPAAAPRPATVASASSKPGPTMPSAPAVSMAPAQPAPSAQPIAPARPAPFARPAPAAQLPLSPRIASAAPVPPSAYRPAPAVPRAPSGIPTPAAKHPEPSERLAASTRIRIPEKSSPAAAAAVEPPLHTIQVTRSERRIDPNVESAYAAFSSGNLQAARQGYQKALESDAHNRDALLGLAAIDVRTRDYQGAAVLYQKVLESDPRDAVAQAGLLGLRTNIDPVQAESHLKTLLAEGPDAPILEFSLGNQYAAEARWAEAQAAYFKAYSTEPDNPDFAFNLAVSLDQLRHSKLALDYYQKAIALAVSHQASFDRDQALKRVRELSPK